MVDKIFPHTYSSVLETLRARLGEEAPAKIQVLVGPRQVGKTHLLLKLARELGDRAIYLAADEPAAALSGWWEANWERSFQLAFNLGKAVIILDEIHYLPNWSRFLKSSWDRIQREKIPLHVVVSGSYSLHLGKGTRESMAGRFERHLLLHWPAAELATHFGMNEKQALDLAVSRGTYPGAVALLDDTARWHGYVRDAIIEPAIGRDIMHMEDIRKPALLRQVFVLACSHPAQIVTLQKLRGSLAEKGALETIAHYLSVLEEAFLVVPLAKFSKSALRRRSAPPKLLPLNQALIAASQPAVFDEPAADPELWGRWVESACIALAWNAGQTVTYWRAENFEVDMIVEGSWGRWAVEVKTANYTTPELAGLFEFCRRNPGYRPLVLCSAGKESVARRAGIDALAWNRWLLCGLEELL